ncbi:MAG: sulfatase [Acidobacteria bacterium]|nr:MAG: sulfatase [Acidobacteriota bacterium]
MKEIPVNPLQEMLRAVTRRHFFKQAGFGIGAAALSSLVNRYAFASGAGAATADLAINAVNPLAPRPPMFPAKTKNIIYLFMAGAPSQVDLLDYKPKLQELDGQNIPESLVKGERFAFIKGVPRLLGSPYTFKKCGQSGAEISELLPELMKVADDIAIVRSMHTTQFNHAPAQIFMNTGHQIIGRPSMGSWLTYGLGSESTDLPGFVVLVSGENQPDGGKACWGSGFLPTVYQGVEFRSKGDPVLFLTNPEGVSPELRRQSLDLLKDLNESHLKSVGDPEIVTRIASYEMAYRMQTSVPELMDISKEPESIHKLYGTEPGKASFANNCLLARRLVERGVRFVQLFHRGWDNHGTSAHDDIVNRLPKLCQETDQAAAVLVWDLKQRGLLENTLVVWGGEFGRTPMNEERARSKFLGRDHHPRAFTMWLAGGGIKGGVTLGQTDEFGYNPVDDPVEVHDLHATILYLMGLDHTKLTYRFQGRDFRLTDVSGNVVKKLLA